MPTFHLRITGLCAFGPGTTSKTVMLVNAREDRQEPHLPAIFAPEANVVTPAEDRTVRNYDFSFDGWPGGFGTGMMRGFELRGELMSLDRIDTAFSIASGPADNAECPNDADAAGFGWVASMRRASAADKAPLGRVAEEAALDPDVLNRLDSARVQAVLPLDRGLLSTMQFSGHPGLPFRWNYLQDGAEQPTQPSRAIAEVVQLTGEFSGDVIRIHSKLFGARDPLPDIVFHRRTATSMFAWLINMPPPDIRGDRPGDPPAHPHFRHFYRLSTSPGGIRVPHRRGRCTRRSELRSAEEKTSKARLAPTNPKCPPAMFES
jgi:hypothetical protein